MAFNQSVWDVENLNGEKLIKMRIIGLAEDVGYSGAWCKDFTLYSRLLLCQYLEGTNSGKKVLVERPRSLWVHGSLNSSGDCALNG